MPDARAIRLAPLAWLKIAYRYQRHGSIWDRKNKNDAHEVVNVWACRGQFEGPRMGNETKTANPAFKVAPSLQELQKGK